MVTALPYTTTVTRHLHDVAIRIPRMAVGPVPASGPPALVAAQQERIARKWWALFTPGVCPAGHLHVRVSQN